MKTKFLFSLFLLVFFLGCSGYEFTYSKDPKIKEVEKKVVFVVAGNDTTLAKIKLIETSVNEPLNANNKAKKLGGQFHCRQTRTMNFTNLSLR